MNNSLKGKTALVTGGSRSIGRAMAKGLATQAVAVAIGQIVSQALALWSKAHLLSPT